MCESVFSESGNFAHYRRTPCKKWAKCTKPECCEDGTGVVRTSGDGQSSLRAHNAMHARRKSQKWIASASVTTRLVTLLGLSVSRVTHPFTQWLLSKASINPPKTKKAVNTAIEKEGMQMRRRLADQVRELKNNGAKFALSTDECKFRRKNFIGAILHSSEEIPLVDSRQVHLGIIRLREKADAERLCSAIIALLTDFSLTIEDMYLWDYDRWRCSHGEARKVARRQIS